MTSLRRISTPPVDKLNDNILFTEIEWAVQKFKRNKSPGIDMVTGEMIQASGPEWIKAFHQVCNNTWESGIVPDTWKKSVLVTIHKKGSTQEYKNYRTIALISLLGKVLIMILNRRLQTQVEEHLADEQAWFRKDRGAVQQILALQLLVEKARRKGRRIYSCFIDFQKAFDNINQEVAWEVLKSYGVNHTLIDILKDINESVEAAVRIQNELGNWFRTNKGARQGDPISPQLFITILERAMDGVTNSITGISIQGMRIDNLRFADDIVLLEENPEDLSGTIDRLCNGCRPYGMVLNLSKTKTMVFGERNMEETLKVNGEEIQNVEEFTYLGSTVTYDLDCKKEVTLRFAKAKGVLMALDTIWKSKEIS